MEYDFLVVGAGLSGATFARIMTDKGKKCLVIDKRPHIAGNAYTENVDGIIVHKYGAHIFHTDNEDVWKFVNRFATFNNYINSPLAYNNGKYYHLPFNLNTFKEIWGIDDIDKIKKIIQSQSSEIDNPNNLEEKAISLVGTDIYNLLIKGYTEKQWGKPCNQLPASIIERLPLRFTYNNNYFNDKYQGIPNGGYTKMVENMLNGIEVRLNTSFKTFMNDCNDKFKNIVYTGPIDEYFNYSLGKLEYRSLRFVEEKIDEEYFQSVAVVNYTNKDVPYTRIVEHKHFEHVNLPYSIITKEYPCDYSNTNAAYYPINDKKNDELYQEYLKLKTDVIFCGRLGLFSYLDMDDTIKEAILLCDKY